MREGVSVRADRVERLTARVDELRQLYRLTDQLYRARSPQDVYDAALHAILSTLGCGRASILLFDEAGVMRFVAWRGLSEGYRRAVEGHSPWKPGEADPKPIFVTDIERTAEPDWLKTTVRKEGIRGLAFIPLVACGGVIGKFMTYHDEPHAFDEHDVELAVTIARQVGFSLERAEAERARRRAEEELRESEARFRLMCEQAPVMIWLSDAAGNCLHLNRMLRAFWSVEEDRIAQFDWRDMVHPQDAEALAGEVEAALARRDGFSVKARFRDATGAWRLLETVARPRASATGEFLGLIGVNVDVTERERAKKALRDSEERFRLAVEAAPSGMVMSDAAGRIVLVNAQAEKLFGYSREDLVGRSVESLVPARSKAAHPGYRRDYHDRPQARPMGAGRDLFAARSDGTEIPVEIGLSPIESSEGTMALAAVVDISARKQAEAQRELLLDELNHRVKNTLAIVQGIAHQTFKEADAAARKTFEGRLVALAMGHNLLTRANWENVSLAELASVTLQLRDGNGRRVSVAGPDIELPAKEALALTMALHELHVNAVKYGALSAEGGAVALEWSRTADPRPRLRLVWRERGGPPVAPPARRGFGSLLLERMLARDLDGEVSIEFAPQGVVCAIEAPLPSAREAAHG